MSGLNLSTIPIVRLREMDDMAQVTVGGWVRSRRETKHISFVTLNDGSAADNLQIVIEHASLSEEQRRMHSALTTGAAMTAQGTLRLTPTLPQPYELQCVSFTLCGAADITQYPLQKKEHSHEFLRTLPHLRPRSATFGAIARVRSTLSYALHRFFHARGFWYLHSPIITTHDAEGAGALFRVRPQQESSSSSTGEALHGDIGQHIHADAQGDFFGAPAYLSVSGQLNAESYAEAMGKVYTFGPTFRAENSHTGRHLSEFWMVEPEVAFCDLFQLLPLAEACIKETLAYCVEERRRDIDFLCQRNKNLAPLLDTLVTSTYETMEYTEAIALLERADRAFEYPPHWGINLQHEHEKYLLSHSAQRPLFIVNYPKDIKSFYMRLNDDGRTVSAVDLIVPEVGELIGGSQREERLSELMRNMHAHAIDPAHYQWYVDLRRYGSVPHAGFGLGFDRLVQLTCGISNIRDVVAFPRSPGQALC